MPVSVCSSKDELLSLASYAERLGENIAKRKRAFLCRADGEPRSKRQRIARHSGDQAHHGAAEKEDCAPIFRRSADANYVPPSRTVEDLYAEDQRMARKYAQLLSLDNEDYISVKGGGAAPTVYEKWEDAGIDGQFKENLVTKCTYIRPGAIQAHSIFPIMNGFDVIIKSQSGSGKTLAFLAPIIKWVIDQKSLDVTAAEDDRLGRVHSWLLQQQNALAPFALLVVPTRELCQQTYEQALKLANDCPVTVGRAYGAFGIGMNLAELHRTGCDILCATPGRLRKLSANGQIRFNRVQFLVLDEADSLVMPTFYIHEGSCPHSKPNQQQQPIDNSCGCFRWQSYASPELCKNGHSRDYALKALLKSPGFPSKRRRQTILVTATLPNYAQINAQINAIMRKHSLVIISSSPSELVPNKAIIQRIEKISAEEGKFARLFQILQEEGDQLRALVFAGTHKATNQIYGRLHAEGFDVGLLNADRDQSDRDDVFQRFLARKLSVLVCTDVLSRGIDFKELNLVINFDLPSDPREYLHRIGRTGRHGPGRAITFFDPNLFTNVELAEHIVKFLEEVGQPVPQFLRGLYTLNEEEGEE